MYPRFGWENPNQVVTTGGGWVMMVCLVGLAALVALGATLAFGLTIILPLWAASTIAAALWTASAVAIGYAVFSSGVAQLRNMDWDQ